MERNRASEKYRKRLQKESILKALFLGIILGSVALVIVGFFTWLFGYKNGLFIALALFAVIVAGTSPLFYFLHFRPTEKQLANRVDALGLEERMLTMTELEKDESFIAQAQRADTVRALGKLDHMMIRIAISAVLIVALCIACLFGLGMVTVSSLYYAGVIESGMETFTPEYVPKIYTVSYAVEEGGEGYIIYWTGDWSGETKVDPEGEQVTEGEDAKAVYAIPMEDWLFVCWSDGVRDPYRQETEVDSDVCVEAIFEPMDPDPEEGEQDSSGNGNSSSGDSSGEPQEGEPQEGESNSEQNQGEDSKLQEPSGEPSNSAGGMRDMSSQQIENGNTFYGDVFDDAYDQAMDRMMQDNNIPDELKPHVKDYYESLKTGNNNGNNSGSGNQGGDQGGDQGGEGETND